MQLVLASANAHKLEEVAAILRGSGVTVRPLSDFPEIGEVPEDHDTFVANAIQKAQYVFERLGVPVVADDSGLEVDALDGAPGVHSKRFTPQATAASNNARLLQELAARPQPQQRGARFRCVIAVVDATGARTAEGTCEGHIASAPRGQGGFGYDPLFLPVDFPGRAMAELTMDEKNRISHRGRAFAQLPALLGLG